MANGREDAGSQLVVNTGPTAMPSGKLSPVRVSGAQILQKTKTTKQQNKTRDHSLLEGFFRSWTIH